MGEERRRENGKLTGVMEHDDDIVERDMDVWDIRWDHGSRATNANKIGVFGGGI